MPTLDLDLAQFTGTENHYQYMGGLKLTDGVMHLAHAGQCFWLLDIIWSYQKKCSKDYMLRDIQFWTLKVNKDRTATVICERDTDDVAFSQKIPYTDFPLDEIKIWVEGKTILLPSEH